jgi:hypothetical protein
MAAREEPVLHIRMQNQNNKQPIMLRCGIAPLEPFKMILVTDFIGNRLGTHDGRNRP